MKRHGHTTTNITYFIWLCVNLNGNTRNDRREEKKKLSATYSEKQINYFHTRLTKSEIEMRLWLKRSSFLLNRTATLYTLYTAEKSLQNDQIINTTTCFFLFVFFLLFFFLIANT